MKQTRESVIEVRQVTKTFPSGEGREGKLIVLRGISLDVHRGEIIAVVGASGAGKSTLLHIIGTLEKPTSGSVVYEGADVFSGVVESEEEPFAIDVGEMVRVNEALLGLTAARFAVV